MYGELHPMGGGDTIPLRKKTLLVGRREGCDIVLRFANVSAHHCQLTLVNGYWFVKDLGSRNGTKVNGTRVTEKRVDPGDTLGVAKHFYEVKYSPSDNGAVGPPPLDTASHEIFGKSLLERAGLARGEETKGRDQKDKGSRREPGRYDLLDDVLNEELDQVRRRNEPI